MARHLNRERWMRPKPTGGWMLVRVSAAREAQFPRVYREALRDHGAPRVCTLIMRDTGCSLPDAWARLKAMCNA